MASFDAIERVRERNEGLAYEEYHERWTSLEDDDDGLSDPDMYVEHVLKPRAEREARDAPAR